MERRRLLESAGALAGLGTCAKLASGQDSGASFDTKTLEFWSKQVRAPLDALGSETKGNSPEEPAFVYFDSAKKEFTLATDMDDSDLPESGDLGVTVRVERFRPSVSDAGAFQGPATGS